MMGRCCTYAKLFSNIPEQVKVVKWLKNMREWFKEATNATAQMKMFRAIHIYSYVDFNWIDREGTLNKQSSPAITDFMDVTMSIVFG